MKGSFGPCTYHVWTVTCVHSSPMEVCKRMRQLIGSVLGWTVCIRLHPVPNNGRPDSNEVTSIIVMEMMFVYVVLQSAGYTACRPAKQSGTTLDCLVNFVEE